MELAASSDWKLGAALAAVCVLGAVVIIPMFFSGGAMLHGLADMFSMFAWFMAFVFGVISLVRFLKRQSDAIGTKSTSPNLRVATAPSHRTPQPAAGPCFDRVVAPVALPGCVGAVGGVAECVGEVGEERAAAQAVLERCVVLWGVVR